MKWYNVNPDTLRIHTEHLDYAYGADYLHNGDGVSITKFVDPRTGQNTAYGFDGQYKGDAWDAHPAQIQNVEAHADYVDIHVQTGQTRKIDRVYRERGALELIYERNHADWTEDFIRTHGPAEAATFIMHGLADVVGLSQGKALWDASEAACGHNYGECFLDAAGGSVQACELDGHFVYGFINQKTGHGTGFVYPTWITTHEWKVWWTETHKLEIEYAPHKNTGRRLIFPVINGRTELMDTAHWWLNTHANTPYIHSQD
ncbi:MAG: hypothetical protein AAF267_05555 [Deinococcota bacterium]